MCVLAVAFKAHPGYSLILVGNRDEFYDRPSAAAGWWHDAPGIIGGRDLTAGGSWLGMSRDGRIAVVTNYRDPAQPFNGSSSRGALVRGFLDGQMTPSAYAEWLAARRDHYAGYSLIFGQADDLWYFCNRSHAPEVLEPGIHGLSNRLLNSAWPKVSRVRERLRDMPEGAPDEESLFRFMRDDSVAADELLPDTGIGLDKERALSPIFVRLPGYGTRCTTVITVTHDGSVNFAERCFDENGAATTTSRHAFRFAGAEVTT